MAVNSATSFKIYSLILIKFLLIGIVLSELVFLFIYIVEAVSKELTFLTYERARILIVVYVVAFSIPVLLSESILSRLVIAVKSKRIDVHLFIAAGIAISFSYLGIGGRQYSNIATTLGLPANLAFLIMIQLMVWFSYFRKKLIPQFSNSNYQSFFLDDAELIDSSKDLLNQAEQAKRFAERLANSFTDRSIVFGIDAPWGVGKSTFANMCVEHWSKNYSDTVIVYRFNPTHYEDKTSIVEKFTDGLGRELSKHVFAPELKPEISRYSDFIIANSSFQIPGSSILSKGTTITIDDSMRELERTLDNLNQRIIVIIDDLDRMNFDAIKNILFLIRKCFALPNINYLLCYDTTNISSSESADFDSDKIAEFLEKYVSVKISLFINSNTLISAISKIIDNEVSKIPLVDTKVLRKITGGINRLLRSKYFHQYMPMIGDLRKVKRLINIILYVDLGKTDLEESSINSDDLINLILIYINYPGVFKKIYACETNGHSGFFSIVRVEQEDQNNSRSMGFGNTNEGNSEEYKKYIKGLPENAKFLLNRIFSLDERLGQYTQLTDDDRNSYACFNGVGGPRNLEQYLNLIVNFEAPPLGTQYKFHRNLISKIGDLSNPDELLDLPEFNSDRNEESHILFWRVVTNSLNDLNPSDCKALVQLALSELPKRSRLEIDQIGIGARDNTVYSLLHLLDRRGWSEGTRHQSNTNENVVEIADWLLGDGEYKNKGLIEALADPSRGINGIYDMLLVRLYSSSNRDNDLFNISRALILHRDKYAKTEGVVSELAKFGMLEISQLTFRIFCKLYIKNELNIFKEIENMTLEDLSGNYAEFIRSALESGEISQRILDSLLLETKAQLRAFITYQLGTPVIASGIGCGYFPVSSEKVGEDSPSIQTVFNKYLFDHCFSQSEENNGYEYFFEYLISNYSLDYSSDELILSESEMLKVLEKDRLIEYWSNNSNEIRIYNFPAEKKIYNNRRELYFADYTEKLFKILDDLVTVQSTNTDKDNENT